MKKYILIEKLLFMMLLLTTCAAFSQEAKPYTIGLANISATANTIEMDVTLTIDNPQKKTRLSQLSVGINYDAAILGDGMPCNNKNCGSWVYIGGKSPALKALANTINTAKAGNGHLRIVGVPLHYESAIVLENGTYTLGRYRFVNVAPWSANTDARLWIQPNNEGNKTNTIMSVFAVDGSKKMVAYSALAIKKNNRLALAQTDENPLHLILNAKANADQGFNAVAFPNPFSGSFQLNMTTIADDNVEIKVYDMLGKLVDQKTLVPSDVASTQIGNNYPSGIYNINISQGGDTKSLRLVKR